MLCIVPVNSNKKHSNTVILPTQETNNNIVDINEFNEFNAIDNDIQEEIKKDNKYDKKLVEPSSRLDRFQLSESNICISYNKSTKIFTIKNIHDDGKIGSFDINDIIKYFTSTYDNKFLNNIEQNFNSTTIIKKFIGYISQENIILYDYEQSPIMGDLNTLIRINNELYLFEKNRLDKELETVDIDNRDNIKMLLGLLINKLLNHTLKIIAYATEEIKGKSNSNKLKDQLFKYSIGMTYRVHKYVENEIKNMDNKINKLFMKLEQSENIRLQTNTKIDDLTNLIITQNENIEEIKKEKKYQTQEFNDKIKYIYETLDILINKGDNLNNIDQPDDNLEDHNENHSEEKSTSEKYNSDSNNGSIILGLDGMISVNENDDKMSDIAKKFSDFKYSTDDSDKILDIILKK